MTAKGNRTRSHLVCKGTFTQFGQMVECLFTMQVIVCSSPLKSVSLLILPLSWARSSLTVKQSQNVDLSKCVCDMIKTHNNTMVYTKPFSHQLQCIPTNSHSLPPLPFTPTYFYSFLNHSFYFWLFSTHSQSCLAHSISF